MQTPIRICTVSVRDVDGAKTLVRDDGLPWPEHGRYCQAGDKPGECWLMSGPSPEPELATDLVVVENPTEP